MVTAPFAEVGSQVLILKRAVEARPETCAGAVGALRLGTLRVAERFGGRADLHRMISPDGRAYRMTFWADVPVPIEEATAALREELLALGVQHPGKLVAEEGAEMECGFHIQDDGYRFHPDAEANGSALIAALGELQRRQRAVYEQWQQEYNV